MIFLPQETCSNQGVAGYLRDWSWRTIRKNVLVNANFRCAKGRGGGGRARRRTKIERSNRRGLSRNEFAGAGETVKICAGGTIRQLHRHRKGEPKKGREKLH